MCSWRVEGRQFVCGLLFSALCVYGCSSRETETPPGATPPSVVLISIDTVRPDHLGAYGYNRDTSPNIDGLAKGGVLFARAWVQAPWTLPSHMSLFTSMLPSQNSVDSINRALPASIPMLAELMRANGYSTAALVNDGQMQAHWGFSRGFDLWREFKVDTPEGDCDHISDQAVRWLDSRPRKPFFLFLHYYDAHDPYAAPEPYRRKFGTNLSGEQARQIAWQARFPENQIRDPEMMKQIVSAYDAEIAWMDSELGKVFAKIPDDALIVVFSDHGESFEEHGWMLHGAALYEEETRAAMIMRLPGGNHGERVINDPVQLMDIAPTILSICGIDIPDHFRGRDLSPAIKDEPLTKCIIESETKAVMEGRFVRSAMLYPWKMSYSVFDARYELYKLPDENNNLYTRTMPRGEDREIVALLRTHVNSAFPGDFWMIHAHGSGKYEITLTASNETFSMFIPIGMEPDRDNIESADKGKRLTWTVFPRGRAKAFYLESPGGAFSVDVLADDQRKTEKVFLSPAGHTPRSLPVTLPAGYGGEPTTELGLFSPTTEGVHILHYRPGKPARSNVIRIDDAALRQLRSLGYIR